MYPTTSGRLCRPLRVAAHAAHDTPSLTVAMSGSNPSGSALRPRRIFRPPVPSKRACTEARRLRTEARRGDRHRGARRGAPGVVHLSQVGGHRRVVALAARQPDGVEVNGVTLAFAVTVAAAAAVAFAITRAYGQRGVAPSHVLDAASRGCAARGTANPGPCWSLR